MRVCYDTEFLEDGKTIELISIGLVTDDGEEYYAVNHDAPWGRIRKQTWLMKHVVPQLPQPHGDARNYMPKRWVCDYLHPSVKTRSLIAKEVKQFLLDAVNRDEHLSLKLWADYGAYDHVALCQLFGQMIELPPLVPMYTNDLQQALMHYGVDNGELPRQEIGFHRAIDDARHVMNCLRWLDAREKKR